MKTTRQPWQISLFAKYLGLIVLLFIPIGLLFAYSNNVATDVIGKEIRASNIKQLSFLSSQIETERAEGEQSRRRGQLRPVEHPDRFYRNARTLTLHDPVDRQREAVGRSELQR
ncbi:hypothetical protein [Cohnella thailandensis]|uniref:Uncharacterized protein n=1 Tax=Cohnella thailandensis TaxID=557557 RepID=A0A841SPC6_9BACL|nr:hypothetical protein [Cohnella thailandensis]MBB6634293.1 hypothetical protein [Cohnella thailandensis]MBP1972208.1 hypothetical protein [Cohnella thailandensis]